MSELLLKAILKFKPDHSLDGMSKREREVWLDKQGLHFDRLHRLKGNVSWSRQEAVLRWLPTDPPDSKSGFLWSPQVQRGASFRAKFDKLEQEMRKPTRGNGEQGRRDMDEDCNHPELWANAKDIGCKIEGFAHEDD